MRADGESVSPVAVGKPVIAKFADVRSRAQAYLVVREYTSSLPVFGPEYGC